MTIKRVREELQALKEQLTGPSSVAGPSALDDIEARLERLAVRQREAGEQPTPSDTAGFAMWWRERFGQESPKWA